MNIPHWLNRQPTCMSIEGRQASPWDPNIGRLCAHTLLQSMPTSTGPRQDYQLEKETEHLLP